MRKAFLIIFIIYFCVCCKEITTDPGSSTPTPIKIGTQTWMSRNLDVTTYRNGDLIPQVTDKTQWKNLKTGAWCYYDNESPYGTKYGKLYNYWAVTDPRGLAPEGWHVPSDSDWTVLSIYLGGKDIAGGKMKETGLQNWDSPNKGATNESGFTAIPSGTRFDNGDFINCCGSSGTWWTSTYFQSLKSSVVVLSSDDAKLHNGNMPVNNGFSVRCIMDNPEMNIYYYSPFNLFIGDTLIIQGNNLGSIRGSSTVTFKPTNRYGYFFVEDSCFISWSNSSIKMIAPNVEPTGKIYVTINKQKSNELNYSMTSGEVKIGTTIVMNKNLNVIKYRNGDTIPQVKDKMEWRNLTTGAWCYYNNDSDKDSLFGKLYNWYAVNDPRGLAPAGWHIPSDVEWSELETSLGGSDIAGGKLKNYYYWYDPNTGATNERGFNANPGGSRSSKGDFNSNFGNSCMFWTSADDAADYAWSRSLYYLSSAIGRVHNLKKEGFSVRCVRNK